MASIEPHPSPPPSPSRSTVDPILRNALRYTISAKEYKTLHQYLITRSPQPLRKRAPPPARIASILSANDDYNAAAIRASLRIFIASQTGLQLWELITTRILGRGKSQKSVCLEYPSHTCIYILQGQAKDIGLSISQSAPLALALPHPTPPSSTLPLFYPSSV